MKVGHSLRLVPVCFLIVLGVAGCSASGDTDKKIAVMQEQISKLQADDQELKEKVAALSSTAPTTSANTAPTTSASTTSTRAASTAPTTTTSTDAAPGPNASSAIGFSDIKGVFGEKEITDLNKLGIFDSNSGKFEPLKPITRAQFVSWLVKANNAFYHHDIRLAESGDATFPDVPNTDPNFKYIQGMVNAGYVVGFDDKTFKPNAVLTREQMIALKVPVDQGGGNFVQTCGWGGDAGKDGVIKTDGWHFSDSKKISKKYWSAITLDSQTAANNIQRTFGTITVFHPQQPVTRAEAAVCLWKTGYSTWDYGHGNGSPRAADGTNGKK